MILRVATDLGEELGWTGDGFEEIVRAPDDVVERILQLPGALNLSGVLQDTPGKQSDGECHRQLVLHIVTGIVIPSAQIHLRFT